MGLRNIVQTDLMLLHAPSVYDFRNEVIMHGPVADVVPSTSEFEMYPIGLTSIASYLAQNHYNVRIVNLAYLMLHDPQFDVQRFLSRQQPRVFGIDLHWLPHAQGALAIAELVKHLHPETPVLMGGLSASYYHAELIRYPFVDYVLRGDSTEEPCRQLLQALRERRPPERVENLTWQRPDGTVVVNPLTFVPADLDYVDVPAYRYMTRSVFKYGSVRNLVPYQEWPQYPTTMLLNARGCPLDCAVCGGSRSAYRRIGHRSRPAYRSPEKLVADVRSIRSFSRAPIFMVHDVRIGGAARAERFFQLLRQEQPPNEFVFELFYLADDAFFRMVQESVAAWSLEITIESPDERLRALNGKFPCTNAELEATIASALAHGCRKLDLFFMVGIPHQTAADALATVDYCRKLVERFEADRRLQFFIAPLAPFLDPGCRAFEEPQFGYTRRYDSLEEHRRALLQPTWKQVLSYETAAMSRDQLVAASYAVAEGLNALKRQYGLIDDATHQLVARHLRVARETLTAIEAALDLPVAARQAAFARIKRQVTLANDASLYSQDALKWAVPGRFRVGPALVGELAGGLAREFGQSLSRLLNRYDTAVYQGKRLEPTT